MSDDDYKIVSAYYASPDKSCVIIHTSDFGDVMVHKPDRPGLWAAVMDWVRIGGTIEPYREVRGEPDVD